MHFVFVVFCSASHSYHGSAYYALRLQHSKWRAPNISTFPTDSTSHSSLKVDHWGSYANESGGRWWWSGDNSKEGTVKAWVGRRRGEGQEHWSGLKEGIEWWYHASLIWSSQPVIHRNSFVLRGADQGLGLDQCGAECVGGVTGSAQWLPAWNSVRKGTGGDWAQPTSFVVVPNILAMQYSPALPPDYSHSNTPTPPFPYIL